MAELTIQKYSQEIYYFAEPMPPGANVVVKPMNMVLIMGGSFLMGSPDTEIDRRDSENHQHLVNVPSFFMSEFLITQAHWWAVAQMPRIKIELEDSPAHFKGTDRPVESVNWFEAVEFCQRLSKHDGRIYRLPSEAEWEYACRAGTTTPFYFGETITTDLANYRGTDSKEYKWSGSYDRGLKGIYLQKTTVVNTFLPNAFGLYDMHGNVWEWCQDNWHSNYYQGAPTDGSAWMTGNNNDSHVMRGGSWNYYPRYCRSAVRYIINPDLRYSNVGFRVVCEMPRT
jgi:formylglycine-generating enzyme required for sulfatase activity